MRDLQSVELPSNLLNMKNDSSDEDSTVNFIIPRKPKNNSKLTPNLNKKGQTEKKDTPSK
jgi:hypothetical protein